MQQNIFSDYFAGLELVDISGRTMGWMAIIGWMTVLWRQMQIQTNQLTRVTTLVETCRNCLNAQPWQGCFPWLLFLAMQAMIAMNKEVLVWHHALTMHCLKLRFGARWEVRARYQCVRKPLCCKRHSSNNGGYLLLSTISHSYWNHTNSRNLSGDRALWRASTGRFIFFCDSSSYRRVHLLDVGTLHIALN